MVLSIISAIRSVRFFRTNFAADGWGELDREMPNRVFGDGAADPRLVPGRRVRPENSA